MATISGDEHEFLELQGCVRGMLTLGPVYIVHSLRLLCRQSPDVPTASPCDWQPAGLHVAASCSRESAGTWICCLGAVSRHLGRAAWSAWTLCGWRYSRSQVSGFLASMSAL